MRIYTNGAEMVSDNEMEKFWDSLEEPKEKMPTPWSILFRNQDKIVITIEKGSVHIETDTCHYLFSNRFMEKEFEIEFLVRCEYCRRFTPATISCEYCGALFLYGYY